MASQYIVALIVAAGKGERAGGALPKQFRNVAGLPMIAHSHAALSAHPAIDEVIVVIGDGQASLLNDALGDVPHAIGGATRRLSVANGLAAIAPRSPSHVLVHDAARPFLPAPVIDRLIDALDTNVAAIPALAVSDTLVRGTSRVEQMVPRDGVWRVQTPQAFQFDILADAHARWPGGDDATDDAQLVRAIGHDVAIVEGDRMLEKITHPADFALADAGAASRLVSRSATGFDVHRLEAGEQLWLGGVLVPHDKGLSGHSDADVALHAITDAVLGTIGAGDIGQHFPPSDPKWKGAASAQFLEHAVGLLRAAGGILDFVDLTLICEAPKVGPHRQAMRERIAALLRLPLAQVSVKATTTERLGFAGRGEGIAAQAIATARVPTGV